MPKMTTQEFKDLTGRWPKDDDMDRVNCTEARSMGHWFCGVCTECGMPRFECHEMHDVKVPHAEDR